jgi:hypothetical protein
MLSLRNGPFPISRITSTSKVKTLHVCVTPARQPQSCDILSVECGSNWSCCSKDRGDQRGTASIRRKSVKNQRSIHRPELSVGILHKTISSLPHSAPRLSPSPQPRVLYINVAAGASLTPNSSWDRCTVFKFCSRRDPQN